MTGGIPIISLAPSHAPADVAQAIADACTQSGFFAVVDHGIPQEDIDSTFSLSQKFFTTEREEEKERVRAKGINIGWTTLRAETLDPSKGKKGDLHESFYVAKYLEDGLPQQALPPTLASGQERLYTFFRQCHSLSLRLLEYFALSLGLPQDYFTPLHLATLDRLRLLHYPEHVPNSTEEDARTGSHSDYGALTCLFAPSGGLEVLLPNGQDALSTDTEGGVWTEAPVIPGAVIVNIGDAMEAWTQGRFRSTLHRVPLPAGAAPPRYSIAYFCQPEADVVLSPLTTAGVDPNKWREVLRAKNVLGKDGEVEVLTAGEHLRRRLASTYKSS